MTKRPSSSARTARSAGPSTVTDAPDAGSAGQILHSAHDPTTRLLRLHDAPKALTVDHTCRQHATKPRTRKHGGGAHTSPRRADGVRGNRERQIVSRRRRIREVGFTSPRWAEPVREGFNGLDSPRRPSVRKYRPRAAPVTIALGSSRRDVRKHTQCSLPCSCCEANRRHGPRNCCRQSRRAPERPGDVRDGPAESLRARTAMPSLCDARHAGLLVPLFSMPSTSSWGVGEIYDIPLMAAWLRECDWTC